MKIFFIVICTMNIHGADQCMVMNEFESEAECLELVVEWNEYMGPATAAECSEGWAS